MPFILPLAATTDPAPVRRRLAVRILGLASLLALSSCLTPSVPIPPPEPEKITFAVDVEAGSASFSYAPDPSYSEAVVYVFNRDIGEGVITTADSKGAVEATPPFPASVGDSIVVTFEVEDQLSSTCVTLRDGQSSSEFECDL